MRYTYIQTEDMPVSQETEEHEQRLQKALIPSCTWYDLIRVGQTSTARHSELTLSG